MPTQLTKQHDPLWPSEADIDYLSQQWQTAKAAEDAAHDRRIAIEQKICQAFKDQLPQKGSKVLSTGLKVTTGFTEKWDQEGLNRAYHTWDAPVPFPFKGEWKPDGKAIAYIRENLPRHYKSLQPLLTLTDKKPAFSMK